VKSRALRDILKDVLNGAHGVSPKEDKPAAYQASLLFPYGCSLKADRPKYFISLGISLLGVILSWEHRSPVFHLLSEGDDFMYFCLR
jgi:hypothetical protein